MESKQQPVTSGKSAAASVRSANSDTAIPADKLQDAQAATTKEHSMSLLESIKLYPKAIGWSLVMSSSIIMEGYDVALMSPFYAMDPFTEKYGELRPDGTYQLTAAWQAGLSNAMVVGQIFGLFITGYVSEKFGYRKTMLTALTAVLSFIFILFFAPNLRTLLVGEILLGMPLGVFQTMTVTYASEVCPVVLRSYLTTYVNACWVIGQLLAAGVLRGMTGRNDQWAYRIPFGVQWAWPIPIMVGVFLAPESPWWLVRQGRKEEAVVALTRLTSKKQTDFDANETIAMIIHTDKLEKEMESGTSYVDCFKGVNLRRTEIVCLTWAAQNLCGQSLMGYSTYFYTQAGLPGKNAFNMSLGQYGLGLIGTIFSWFLMMRFGRRTLYLSGLAVLAIVLFVIGFISFAGSNNTAASWTTGSFLVVYTFIYDSTVGPVCYSLVSELSSTRLRAKSIVLARNLYNVVCIVSAVIIPYMLNPTAWNWRGKVGFFWGSLCLLCVTWTYF